MTLASVWKGETETGILCRRVLRVHWNAFNVTLSELSVDTSWLRRRTQHESNSVGSSIKVHSPTVKLPLVTESIVTQKYTVNNRLCAKMTCLVLRPYSTLDRDQHSSTLQM